MQSFSAFFEISYRATYYPINFAGLWATSLNAHDYQGMGILFQAIHFM
jgi:hypothetical protein